MISVLWYLTVLTAIWGSSLGGVTLPGIGLVYPFRVIAILLAIAVLIRNKGLGLKLEKQDILSPLVLVAGMLAYGALSLLWTGSVAESAKALLNLFYVLIFLWLFKAVVTSRELFNRTALLITANGVALLLLGVMEANTGIYLFARGYVTLSEVWVKRSDFLTFMPLVCTENTNNYALTIVLSLPFMLYCFDGIFKSHSWYIVSLKMVLIALSVYVIMQTESRLTYIAMAALLLLYCLLRLRHNKLEIVTIPILVIAVIAGQYFVTKDIVMGHPLNPPIELRVNTSSINGIEYGEIKELQKENLQAIYKSWTPQSILNDVTVAPKDVSYNLRLILLKAGVGLVVKNFGLGIGPAKTAELIPGFLPPGANIVSFHLLYLEIAVQFGVLFALWFLLIQFKIIYQAGRVLFKSRDETSPALLALPGAIVFLALSAVASSELYVFIVWISLAMWDAGVSRLVKSGKPYGTPPVAPR